MRIAEPLPLVARRRRGYLIPTPSFDSRPLDETEKNRAVCAQADPELWFADHPVDQAEAKRLCHTCPLTDRCIAIALDHRPAVQGIWAGTTEKDRAVIRPAWRRARKAAAQAKADAEAARTEKETSTTATTDAAA